MRNLALLLVAGACGGGGSAADDGGAADAAPAIEPVVFPANFRFGAASSAHQIEGDNQGNDWWQFETLKAFADSVTEPSGQAADGYARHEQDADLAAALKLDVQRLSIEWSRIEPVRGQFDESEIAHYRDVLEALRERGLAPSVTLHHFTSPTWVQDLRDVECAKGPSDANLCGWSNGEVAVAFEAFVARVAEEYGDLVDEWITLNEPNVVVITGFVLGQFPPARLALTVTAMQEYAAPALRTTIEAHARGYRAVHEHDTVDADGDGVPARVGLAISAMHMVPAHDTPEDQGAAERARYLYNYLHADAIANGGMDLDLDGVADEKHPDWRDTLDFLAFQYYARIPVIEFGVLRPLDLLPCLAQIGELLGPGAFKTLGCPEPAPEDVTQMGYEHFPDGLAEVARDYHARYPDWPLLVSENGIGTRSGRRRAQSVVRHLRALAGAMAEGVPVEGYYHWSLTDNFEWAEGFRPRFGLYSVDFDSFARTATEGADVYGAIASDGTITPEQIREYGEGPMAPEPGE